ncbi:MAG: sigma-54 dependent transcriptional regulator [Quisquiliibacterium sp.]
MTWAAEPRVARILIVDDEATLRELLELTLVGMGLDVDCAADLAQARRFLANREYALCITDMRLPDGMGLELVEEIAAKSPMMPVAVLTAYGSAENAVAALKAGAFDYLSKPVALEALRNLIRSALRAGERADDQNETSAAARLLGDSAAMHAVRDSIARLARSMAPVAINGESGSGKELAARAVHEGGSRASKPFIPVNCGAIPESLMEAEFFGYRKGAFTGADQDRAGFFQAADGGTLFLDEVADLPLPMQVKLLRAIQERTVRRVGATTEETVDVRIISATHQDLAQCVTAGRFRQDLYYRLNVIELKIPPLRERASDIEQIARAILERLANRAAMNPVPRLSVPAAKYLRGYEFPGNVRELENILERAIAFSDGDEIRIEDLGLRPTTIDVALNERASADADQPDGEPAGQVRLDQDGIPASLPDYLEHVEREAILRALEKTRHNRTAAARLLGITFRALRYRMQRLGIN